MKRDTLTGKRILVTRAVRQAGKLSDALRELGATPVEVPVIEIQPAEDFAPLEKAIRQLNSYDWLIFTSANAVSILAFNASLHGFSIHNSPGPKIAAIGRATAEAVERAHLKVDLVPEDYVAESLVDAFLKRHEVSGHDFSRAKSAAKKEGALAPEGNLAGQRILIARAAIARDVIPDALRAAGAHVDVVDAYRNVMPQAAPALLRAALEQGIDAATFTSSSSVRNLAEVATEAGVSFPFAGVKAISIGPVTSATLREFGWEAAGEAEVSDLPGLIDAVVSALA